jgi:hypothetical protein
MNLLNYLPDLLTGSLLRGVAYLDPGSGSFILQVLIATLVGGLFIVRAYWQKIVSFFRSRSSKEEDEQEE